MKFLTILSAVILLASCSTVKKSRSFHTEQTDSTRVVHEKETTVSKVDSAGVTESKEEYSRTITIDFDSTDFELAPGYETEPNDYLPQDTGRKQFKGIRLKLSDKKELTLDLGGRKPSRIIIHDHGKRVDSSAADVHRSETAIKENSDSGHVTKNIVDKAISKEKKSVPLFLQLTFLGAMIVLVIIALIVRDKKQNNS